MLNQAFFYGTGEDEPKGMIIADMFADAGTEGKFLNIKTGFEKKLLKDFVEMESDGTNFGKYTNENIERSTKFIDSILEMKHSIAPEFRDSLDIMAHSTAIAQMMKVRIGKEYAYSSVDRTFLGIKVYDNNVMPAFVKNEAKEDKVPSLLMANYKEFYAYIFGSIDCWVNTKTADGIPQITMQYVAGGTPIDTRACAGLTCAE
jgi:HK97 family phage major capsid protein